MIHVIWSRGDWFLFAEIESPIEAAAAAASSLLRHFRSEQDRLERRGERRKTIKTTPSFLPSFCDSLPPFLSTSSQG